MNALKTIRSHWKKTVFFSGVCAYGVNYAKNKYEDWILMKNYCLEAKKLGEMPLNKQVQPAKVVVILNPAANRGKGRDEFKKKVAPLLHLAAFDVDLLLSKQEGDGKKLVSDVGDVSAVVVAGGDGTLSEVVTGMMKRTDENTFSQTPICVVPLGRNNTLAHLLHPADTHNETKFKAEMVMSLVRASALKYVDVFSVQGEGDKKVYGVANLSVGAFTDSDIKRNTWFCRLLGGRVGVYIASIFSKEDLHDLSLSFTEVCHGCNRCVQSVPEKRRHWWSFIVAPFIRKPVTPALDFTNVNNENCGKLYSQQTPLSQIDLIANIKTNSLLTRLFKEGLSGQDYRKFGMERRNNEVSDERIREVVVSSLQLNNMNEARRLQIDSETFDGMKNLSINLLPNKLKFFLNQQNAQLNSS